MEVGHDGGNLQSITGCEMGDEPISARNAQGLSEAAVLAQGRGRRLTPPLF
jgi:hypothetical protein